MVEELSVKLVRVQGQLIIGARSAMLSRGRHQLTYIGIGANESGVEANVQPPIRTARLSGNGNMEKSNCSVLHKPGWMWQKRYWGYLLANSYHSMTSANVITKIGDAMTYNDTRVYDCAVPFRLIHKVSQVAPAGPYFLQ
jgi:hypothetical protein